MRKYLFFFIKILIISIFVNLFIANAQKSQKKKNDGFTPLRLMIVGIEIGKGLKDLPPSKVEAAFALAVALSDYFDLIPPRVVDSVVNSYKEKYSSFTIINLGYTLNADYLVYFNLNKFKNILRCDITLYSGDNFQKATSGKGFAYLNYIDTVTNKHIYDPSLLLAIQRAFAAATRDSSLYVKADKKILPAITLVISGIEFKKNPNLPTWSLFANSVVNSYFLIEKIFEVASKSFKYQPFDIETRDSIYATFNFYAPENYKAPNQMELYALRRFEVETIITGSFEQTKEGGILTLILAKFTSEGLTEVNRVQGLVEKDSLVELEKVIEELTPKLLGENTFNTN